MLAGLLFWRGYTEKYHAGYQPRPGLAAAQFRDESDKHSYVKGRNADARPTPKSKPGVWLLEKFTTTGAANAGATSGRPCQRPGSPSPRRRPTTRIYKSAAGALVAKRPAGTAAGLNY